MSCRQFGRNLEEHPSVAFLYVDAYTGPLGHGLAMGVGMALDAGYLDKMPYRTCVLLGDSETAEGSNWGSIQIAAHYQLDNLLGVLVTVEDHFAEGRLADAVRSALSTAPLPVHSLAVRVKPRSGKPRELLDCESISRDAIVSRVKHILQSRQRHRKALVNTEAGS